MEWGGLNRRIRGGVTSIKEYEDGLWEGVKNDVPWGEGGWEVPGPPWATVASGMFSWEVDLGLSDLPIQLLYIASEMDPELLDKPEEFNKANPPPRHPVMALNNLTCTNRIWAVG